MMYQSSVKPLTMSKPDDLHLYTISFEYNGERYSFRIYHNLPDVPGLSMKDALINWIARTDEVTEESLCKYIESKNTGYDCLSLKEFKAVIEMMESSGRDTTELRKLLPDK